MNFLRSAAYSLAAAGITLAGLALSTDEAEARVVAYSRLDTAGFRIIAGAHIIDLSSITVLNTTESSAHLDGANISQAEPVFGWFDSAPSDVGMSCLGDCGGIAENLIMPYSLINSTATFSRSDALITGSLLIGSGARGITVAETQLNGPHVSSANSDIGSTANFTNLSFTASEDGNLMLHFALVSELRVFSDEEQGVASANYDFSIDLTDADTGEPIAIEVTRNGGYAGSADVNDKASIIGAGQLVTLYYSEFGLTVTGLLAEHSYNLQISQHANVTAFNRTRPVTEPGAIGLLGLGLLGLAGLSRRRDAA